jgi:hypothetical protein
MTGTGNPYCATLGISVPSLADAARSADANYYSLLLVALLECGAPMTLADVALRFEALGLAPAEQALASLKRCKPARAPIYRDGDHYALDPHDDEVRFWLFRLGFVPPRAAPLQAARPSAEPLPDPTQPLTAVMLDEAWREGVPSSWSAQRVAIAVLDAHDGPMSQADVVAVVAARSQWSPLGKESSRFWRRGAVIIRADGLWELDRGHDAVRSARTAVRDRIGDLRRWAARRPDPAALKAHQARIERERAEHGQQLTRLRRALLHAFPASKPQAVVLLDVDDRAIETYIGDEIAHVVARLARCEIIGAVGVRPLLRSLNVDARDHRLAELGPPQKTRQLNRRGRTLAITMPLLVQGSCGISRPFGDPQTLREYLHAGADTKLRRRLEADMKSLFALYQYGRVHGAVRLRWGFLDEMLPAPWVHRDEPTLHDLLKAAYQRGVPLDVVVGSAPGWADPWARARRAYPAADAWGWPSRLADEDGYEIPRADVQLARLAAGEGEGSA